MAKVIANLLNSHVAPDFTDDLFEKDPSLRQSSRLTPCNISIADRPGSLHNTHLGSQTTATTTVSCEAVLRGSPPHSC